MTANVELAQEPWYFYQHKAGSYLRRGSLWTAASCTWSPFSMFREWHVNGEMGKFPNFFWKHDTVKYILYFVFGSHVLVHCITDWTDWRLHSPYLYHTMYIKTDEEVQNCSYTEYSRKWLYEGLTSEILALHLTVTRFIYFSIDTHSIGASNNSLLQYINLCQKNTSYLFGSY